MTTAELAVPLNVAPQRKSDASSAPTPIQIDQSNDTENNLENDVSGEIGAGDRLQWPRKIVMNSSETEPDEIEDSAASDF